SRCGLDAKRPDYADALPNGHRKRSKRPAATNTEYGRIRKQIRWNGHAFTDAEAAGAAQCGCMHGSNAKRGAQPRNAPLGWLLPRRRQGTRHCGRVVFFHQCHYRSDWTRSRLKALAQIANTFWLWRGVGASDCKRNWLYFRNCRWSV